MQFCSEPLAITYFNFFYVVNQKCFSAKRCIQRRNVFGFFSARVTRQRCKRPRLHKSPEEMAVNECSGEHKVIKCHVKCMCFPRKQTEGSKVLQRMVSLQREGSRWVGVGLESHRCESK